MWHIRGALDDLRPYHRRNINFGEPRQREERDVAIIPTLEVERSALAMATVTGVRVVDLYSV